MFEMLAALAAAFSALAVIFGLRSLRKTSRLEHEASYWRTLLQLDSSQSASTVSALTQLLDSIVSILQEHTRSETSASVLLVTRREDGTVYLRTIARDSASSTTRERLVVEYNSRDNLLFDSIFKTGMYVIHNQLKDASTGGYINSRTSSSNPLQVQSLLAVPLSDSNQRRVIGVLRCDSPQKNAFPPDVLKLIYPAAEVACRLLLSLPPADESANNSLVVSDVPQSDA